MRGNQQNKKKGYHLIAKLIKRCENLSAEKIEAIKVEKFLLSWMGRGVLSNPQYSKRRQEI